MAEPNQSDSIRLEKVFTAFGLRLAEKCLRRRFVLLVVGIPSIAGAEGNRLEVQLLCQTEGANLLSSVKSKKCRINDAAA